MCLVPNKRLYLLSRSASSSKNFAYQPSSETRNLCCPNALIHGLGLAFYKGRRSSGDQRRDNNVLWGKGHTSTPSSEIRDAAG